MRKGKNGPLLIMRLGSAVAHVIPAELQPDPEKKVMWTLPTVDTQRENS